LHWDDWVLADFDEFAFYIAVPAKKTMAEMHRAIDNARGL
jgi:hypothetical protein